MHQITEYGERLQLIKFAPEFSTTIKVKKSVRRYLHIVVAVAEMEIIFKKRKLFADVCCFSQIPVHSREDQWKTRPGNS